MTIRAVLLGLLGAASICALSYFDEWVLEQTALISHNLPISVFGALVIFILVINPLLHHLGRRCAFTGAELAVTLSLTLAACVVPGAGLMETFPTTLMMPHKYVRNQTSWKGDREELTFATVEDWNAFVRGLRDPDATQAPPIAGAVAAALPDGFVTELAAEAEEGALSVASRRKLLEAVNTVLHGTDLDAASEIPLEAFPKHMRVRVERYRDEIAYVRDLLASLPKRLEAKRDELAAAREEHADALLALATAEQAVRDVGKEIQPELDALRDRRDEFDSIEAYRAKREAIKAPLYAKQAKVDRLRAETREVWKLRYELKILRTALGVQEDGTDVTGDTERALALMELRRNRLLLEAAFPEAIEHRDPSALELAPPRLLADVYLSRSAFLGGYTRGGREGDQAIPFYKIGWEAFDRPFRFWFPVILSLWFGLIALAVVLHRQWANHEQLPYPVAAFANSLLPKAGEARGSVFADKLFWGGAIAVFLFHMNNFICVWEPNWIKIPNSFDIAPLKNLFPTLQDGGAWWFWGPRFIFTVVAFSFFLSTDVSLSIAVGPLIFCYIVGVLKGYGYSLGNAGANSPDPAAMLSAGSYSAIFLAILYTGRHYYKTVFARALLMPTRDAPESRAVWAARIFLVSMVIFIGNLVYVGLDWQLAILYTAGLVMMFVVMGRIIAETGIFFMQTYFSPAMILVTLFGARALGPETLMLLFMAMTVLTIDPREALMPFMVNNLKIMDLRGVRYGRGATLCAVAVVVGLLAAVPATLYFQYDRGAESSHAWLYFNVPEAPFKETIRLKRELQQTGSLETSRSVQGWERFAEATPRTESVIALLVGFGLAISFTVARLKYARWPLHPVLFLIWTVSHTAQFAWSFFLGWLIKTLVMKYGGSGVYNRLKPLMFGLIAGEMLGGFLPAVISWIYYGVTGDRPEAFDVMNV